MPELPDVEVIREYLDAHVIGQTIVAADYVGPIVMRNLLGGDTAAALAGRRFDWARRRGKFLRLGLDDGHELLINFMLAGRLVLCPPDTKRGARTYLVLALSGGQSLRYTDQASMGKIYLTDDPAKAPTYGELGPDALDSAVTLDVFRQRLRRHPGEIKGTLLNQQFVAGIGNAYADEILFEARIYPFLRRSELEPDDIARLHAAIGKVLYHAIAVLRQCMGDDIPDEIRDFLQVHRKGGEPCPRCGAAISQVAANKRITNFCRTCQPGTLIRQGKR
jgi:formamidopyrimidine-DNA glycosylase